MKILITNDDGIHSSGLLAVNNAVKDFGETTILQVNNSPVEICISQTSEVSMQFTE